MGLRNEGGVDCYVNCILQCMFCMADNVMSMEEIVSSPLGRLFKSMLRRVGDFGQTNRNFINTSHSLWKKERKDFDCSVQQAASEYFPFILNVFNQKSLNFNC